MLTGDIIFSQGIPDVCAFIRTTDKIISLSFNFIDDCRIYRIQWIETFRIELNSRHCITAVGTDIRHFLVVVKIDLVFFRIKY